MVRRVAPLLADVDLGPDQLVHADLAGNVLLDPMGAPVVIDVAPAWRPVLWAEAVCVLDAVTWLGAPLTSLGRWTVGAPRQAMLRALIFRAASDLLDDASARDASPYEPVLSVLARTAAT